MSEDITKDYELKVLEAFDKMTSDFKAGTANSDISVSDSVPAFESLDDAVADVPPSHVEATRAARASAQKKKKKRVKKQTFLTEMFSGKPKQTEKPAAKHEKTPEKPEDPGEDKKKKNKKRKKGISVVGKIFLVLFLLFLVACVAAAAFVISYVKSVVEDTPDINPGNIYDLLTENSALYDKDGKLMEYVYAGDALRTNIEYKDMPENLIYAFVCTEDKTFFEHHGVNYVRLVGAVVDSLKSGDRIGGTSTITQQLARNLYLTEIKGVRTLERKLQEVYYTFVIENALSKEQILEAYLNTIYLGYNSNGVASAAQAYFSKDIKDLNLVECAMLAALPQSPNAYAPIKRVSTDSVEDWDEIDVISTNDDWTVYYNNGGEERFQLILKNMHDQGKINDAQYNAAKTAKLRNFVNPGNSILTTATTSYFADYVVDEVLDDMCYQLDMNMDEARNYLYNSGLVIHSTLDSTIQNIMEETYADIENFPSVGSYKKDGDGNVLDEKGNVLLYNMANMFDDVDGSFTLRSNEFSWEADGSLKLLGNNRLNFYKTKVGDKTDYSIEFKSMYEIEETEEGKKIFYSRAGGTWYVGADYKKKDEAGDLTIDASFFKDKPDAFTENADGTITLDQKYFVLQQRVMQPQSAMVVFDYTNGHIVGMVGGRGIEGKLLYNRATSPRQPGSSMKPLAVYSVALEAGFEGLGNFTAATPLDDAPMSYGGSPWPKNWYTGYKGMTNLRNAVEQSINACAVSLFMQLDPYMSVEFLQNMGITTLVTSGNVNDINASALALGGMTKGVSPLEMTAAYGTFGNYGVYNSPISYTTVTNKKGDVILSNQTESTDVMDESVASLMLDILHTTVTRGLGSGAKLKSQPSAGKTGTTSDRYDIWFCGLTPQYSAAVWIGNDTNIALDTGSGAATDLWSKVMERVGALYERKEFELKGSFVTCTVDKHSGKALSDLSNYGDQNCSLTEIFIAGTEPHEVDDSHEIVEVCAQSGYRATPWCPNHVYKVGTIRAGGKSWEKMIADFDFKYRKLEVSSMPDAMYDVPDYYCPIHNLDTGIYPVSPFENAAAAYNPLTVDPISDYEDVEYDEFGNPIAIDPEVEGETTQPGEDYDPMLEEPGAAWDPLLDPFDPEVNVWDENYLSDDPNF